MAGRVDPGDLATMMDFPVRETRASTPMNVQAFLALLRERGGLQGEQVSPLALQRQQALAQALRSGRMGPVGGRGKLPVMPL